MSGNLANFISILYLIVLVFTAGLAVALVWLGLSHLKRPGAVAFITRALTAAFHMITYLVSAVTPNQAIARFAAEIRIPFIAVAQVLTFFFVLEFTANRLRISGLARLLLLIPIALTPVFVGMLDDAFYQQFEQVRFSWMFVERSTYGIWSLVLIAYSIVLVTITSVYLIWLSMRERGEQRARAIWLLLAVVLGILPGTIEFFAPDLTPTDITPLGTWFTMLVYGWLFTRYHLLAVVPFALDSVLRSMEDGVLVVNPRGLIAQVNPAAVRLLGRPESALVGRMVTEVLPGIPADVATSDFQLEQADVPNGEASRPHWLDLRISSVHDARGKSVGRIYALRDATEKKRMQTLLIEQVALQAALQKEQELNQTKTQMMKRIAHEFRTPLAIIQLFGELLERYFDRMTPEQRRERIATVRQQIAVITDMLDDIAMTLRGELKNLPIAPETFDLVGLCRERIAQMNAAAAEREPIRLITTLDELSIHADRRMIDMVLRGLMTNAMKYSPANRPIEVHLADGNDRITLQVRDQGIGIPEEEQERIFETFYRASNIGEIGGLGIGLSLVRSAVEIHNGTIHVDSALGMGSTFTVNLPRRMQPQSVDADLESA